MKHKSFTQSHAFFVSAVCASTLAMSGAFAQDSGTPPDSATATGLPEPTLHSATATGLPEPTPPSTLQTPHSVERPEHDTLPPVFTQGLAFGNDFFESRSDILLPLLWWSGGDGALLLNGRAAFTDGGEQEMNLGLAIRQRVMPRIDGILGLSVFYDSRWTERDSQFDRLGLGAEILTRWVDARFNAYLPENKREFLDAYETHAGTTTRTDVSESELYAVAHEVRERWTERTTRTHTYDVFHLYEVPYKGWDAEIGVKLPIPSDRFEARAFVGYYDFEGKRGNVADISGLKGRVELRAWDRLFLDAELFEDDDLYGTDFVISARLRIPLGRDAFKLERGPYDRMLEQIMRDPHVVTGTDVQHTTYTTTDSATKRIDEILFGNVVFVDNQSPAAAAGNDGTAEHPLDTIQGGVDTATAGGFANVVVHGGKTYAEDNIGYDGGAGNRTVTLNLFGAESIRSTRNPAIALGARPRVANVTAGADIFTFRNMDALTVAGFDIASAAGNAAHYGLNAWDINTVTARDNTFSGMNVGIFARSFTTLTASGNTFSGITGSGIDASGGGTLTAYDNTFSDIGGGISAVTVGTLTAHGNTFSDITGSGIFAEGVTTLTAYDNTFSDMTYGIYADNVENATLYHNSFSGIGDTGIFAWDVDTLTAHGNTFSGMTYGISAEDVTTLTAYDNIFSGITGSGIYANFVETLTAYDNRFSDIGGDGIYANFVGNTLTAYGNRFSGIAGTGIAADTVTTFTAYGNTFSGIDQIGISARNVTTLTAYGNRFGGIGWNGIYAFGGTTFTAHGNRFENIVDTDADPATGSYGHGIYFNTPQPGTIDIRDDNTFVNVDYENNLPTP